MRNAHTSHTGLCFNRFFTEERVSPYKQFVYEKRTSVLRNRLERAVSEERVVEVPVSWSGVATDILAHKYLRQAGVPQPGSRKGAEHSVKQVVHRMAYCWQQYGHKYGFFRTATDAQVFYDEVVFMLLGQYAAPNSPQWFNTGLYQAYGISGHTKPRFFVDPASDKTISTTNAFVRPQPHACFILAVPPNITSAVGLQAFLDLEESIFMYGGGTGSNFSVVPEKTAAEPHADLLSILQRSDDNAGQARQRSMARRAAMLRCLDIDHPDILAFINWKNEANSKLGGAGQNSNVSVRIPDDFFRALEQDADWELTSRVDGRVVQRLPARLLWEQLARAAWGCADPGVQFKDAINAWHTCPAAGPINASNPCSEYLFLDNTACNLASLNLVRFLDDRLYFRVDAFFHACRLWAVVLEISNCMAQFPSPTIARLCHTYRTIGLGYANLGALLMCLGLPYDSEEARALTTGITSLMTATAYKTSAEMAAVLGPFPGYQANRASMMRVLRKHRAATYSQPATYNGLPKPDEKHCPSHILRAARSTWDDALLLGQRHGFRNAQATVIAPTGTIGLLMDCDTLGMEPDFTLTKYKQLAGGGFLNIQNRSVGPALRNLGYPEQHVHAILKYTFGHGTLQGAPCLSADNLFGKGFSPTDVGNLEAAIPAVRNIQELFSLDVLGEGCFARLGIAAKQYQRPDFSLLCALGLTPAQQAAADAYVFGHQSLQGAPFLNAVHMPVFDTALAARKGSGYIRPEGHLRMMAAIQPFISGALSKTVNLPRQTSWQEVAHCFWLAWKLGLKSCAIYRDGSKTAQPLQASSASRAHV